MNKKINEEIIENETAVILDHIESLSSILTEITYKLDSLYSSIVYRDVTMFIKDLDFVNVEILQRKYHMGYARANRIIDYLLLEKRIEKFDIGKYRVLKKRASFYFEDNCFPFFIDI